MKKRVLSLFLAAVLLLSLLPAGMIQTRAKAADTVAYPVEGGNIYFDPSTGTITSCDDTVTSAVIPGTINGIPVTTIGDEAFYKCRSLTNVTIGDSVTTIGGSAFYGCTGLTSVMIPDSVTTIGDEAFSRCDSLTSVMIPDSVTTIGGCAFADCNSLTSVTIGDSVTTIGQWAFADCNSLTSVTIGDSVTTIGDYAFIFCYGLTSVTIPNSVTTIGDRAFESLTSVTVLNANCSIYDDKDTLGVPGMTVIYGYSGSTAESYAEKYGYDFEPLQKVFYENTYKADIWLNLRSGNEVTMESEVIDSVLALPSLSTEMSETLDADKKFQNSLAGWQGMQVVFDPVSAVDDIYLSQEGIYETLILDFLKKSMEDSEASTEKMTLQSIEDLGAGGEAVTKYKTIVDNLATMVEATLHSDIFYSLIWLGKASFLIMPHILSI